MNQLLVDLYERQRASQRLYRSQFVKTQSEHWLRAQKTFGQVTDEQIADFAARHKAMDDAIGAELKALWERLTPDEQQAVMVLKLTEDMNGGDES